MFLQQHMSRDVSQTVFVAIKIHTEDRIARLFALAKIFAVRQKRQIHFNQLFSQRIFQLSFLTFSPSNHKANILMGVVG